MTFNAPTSEDFFTIRDLALQWRVTPQHVYALIRRGQLPAHKIGERVIVRRDAAKSFLDRNATVSAAA